MTDDLAAPADKADKPARRLRQSLQRYRAGAPPGAFRAALAEGLDPAALANPEGLARVQAELKALKVERRALRRIENIILAALGQAAPDGEDED